MTPMISVYIKINHIFNLLKKSKWPIRYQLKTSFFMSCARIKLWFGATYKSSRRRAKRPLPPALTETQAVVIRAQRDLFMSHTANIRVMTYVGLGHLWLILGERMAYNTFPLECEIYEHLYTLWNGVNDSKQIVGQHYIFINRSVWWAGETNSNDMHIDSLKYNKHGLHCLWFQNNLFILQKSTNIKQ